VAVSVKSSGNQTATINTEHSLLDTTDAGVYQGLIDLTNLADGDTLEIRVYIKANASATLSVAYIITLKDAQSSDGLVLITPPAMSAVEWKMTLKQTAGTGRSYQWGVFTP